MSEVNSRTEAKAKGSDESEDKAEEEDDDNNEDQGWK